MELPVEAAQVEPVPPTSGYASREARHSGPGTIRNQTSVAAISSAALAKSQKEKRRAKEHKKRQKAAKQARAEEERVRLEQEARQKEDESPGPSRFLVRLPLSKVSALSGRSICKNFRKVDLDLNDIRTVQLEAVLASNQAKAVLACLQKPLYFVGCSSILCRILLTLLQDSGCREKIKHLKSRLKNAPVCSKLQIRRPDPAEHDSEPRTLSVEIIDAIIQVLQEAGPPHELESSQNSEEKIKSLFKPVLRSIGLDNVLVTT